MKSFFNKRFEEEFLLSEKLRTTILACMFLFSILYSIVNIIIFRNTVSKEALGNSLWHILFFHLALFSFELCSLLFINYNLGRKKHTISLPAAIEIHNELNIQIQNGKIPLTNIGIGIHTGDAVTGNIGTIERQQYSITGSVVILAARIEQLNKDYYSKILISEDVMGQIHHTPKANSEFLGKVDLKGWHHPLGIYKIA